MAAAFSPAAWAVKAHEAAASPPKIPVKVGSFPQEFAKSYAEEDGLPSNDVLSIAVDDEGVVFAGTSKGLALFEHGEWRVLPEFSGKAITALRAYTGGVAIAADRSVFGYIDGALVEGVQLPVSQIHAAVVEAAHPVVLTGLGIYELAFEQDGPSASLRAPYEGGQGFHHLAVGRDATIYAAGPGGLAAQDNQGAWTPILAEDGMGRLWAAADVGAIAVDGQGRLWAGMDAGVICRTDAGWRFYTGKDGLPYNQFTCAAAGPGDSVWFGTELGAIHYDGAGWHYRQGPRWVPDDHIRDVAVSADGAAWFATPKGVGMIGTTEMTLAEKAAFYEAEVEKYIKRTPFGYTSEVHLAVPGDKSSEITRTDSDNDGLWTGMYGAGECFGYAATKDSERKERAKEAFEALRHLKKVTQGGEHSPPKGYVARTILPADGPDPNEGRIERDREKRETDDALWKVYEPRWPKSADGKWYWKSDTSSDELDGHYFFYPAYYDLVADTEEEKARVREVVRDLTDHLIEHGFYMVDHDGAPTRWAVYGPDALNNDPNWWPERGLKSLSILSYLAVARHMTGDAKYDALAAELIEKHGYRHNAMIAKTHFGLGSGNQSDDEMAVMCYYNLMKYSTDEALREQIGYSFYSHWTLMQPERNPFFHFAYAAFGLGAEYTNPWGTHPRDPWKGWLTDSIETLKGFPLDRLNWPHKNSHRLDVVPLPPQQSSEPYEPHDPNRGRLVNGKVLPIENRHFNHWNTDPWRLDYGGDGTTLGSGTVFLLPYYMGLHHGFIE